MLVGIPKVATLYDRLAMRSRILISLIVGCSFFENNRAHVFDRLPKVVLEVVPP
jgi:hypothetical protein